MISTTINKPNLTIISEIKKLFFFFIPLIVHAFFTLGSSVHNPQVNMRVLFSAWRNMVAASDIVLQSLIFRSNEFLCRPSSTFYFILAYKFWKANRAPFEMRRKYNMIIFNILQSSEGVTRYQHLLTYAIRNV